MAQPILLSSPDANDFLQQQKLLTRPEVFRMSKLDQLISETLARTDISDDEKYVLYNAALADFRKVQGDVLKHGTLLEPTADIILQNQIPTGTSSQSAEELLKSVAQLLQDISAETQPRILQQPSSKTEAPIKNEGKKRQQAKKRGSEDLKKLSDELKRANNFQKDLMEKYFTDSDGVVDTTRFQRILDAMTSKEKKFISSVPQADVDMAQNVYNFMIDKNVDVSPWAKDFPLFSQLSSNVSLPARRRGRRKTVGSGVNKKRFIVKWKLWDSHMKK